MNLNSIDPIHALSSLIRFCKEMKLTISVAESATGGRLSSALTALPGSSLVFKEGIVCYSPESKKERLLIKPEVMKQYGLVSQEITLLMAQQVRKALQVDIGIATTGNAGPEANDVLASVGQTYIAISTDKKQFVFPKKYEGSRNFIQNAMTNDAIRTLYCVLEEGAV